MCIIYYCPLLHQLFLSRKQFVIFFLGFCTFYINPHLFSLKLMSTSSLHYPFCPALMAFSSSLPSSMKRSATSMFALETLKRESLFIAHQSSSYITAH